MILFFTYLFLVEVLNFLSGMFNAFMDKTETTNQFENSVFYNKNPLYWSKVAASGAKKLPFTKYPWNAWHNAKSGVVIADSIGKVLMLLAGYCLYTYFKTEWYWWLAIASLWLILHGTIRIQSFNLFYDNLFKKKNP